MAGPADLSHRDLRAIRDLLRPSGDLEERVPLDPADDAPTLPWQVFDELARLLGCDEIGLCEVDHVSRVMTVHQVVDDECGHAVLHEEYDWEKAEEDHFFDYGRCVPRPAGVRRTSAVMTRRQRRDDPYLLECQPDLLDDLVVDFPAPAGVSRRVMLRRFDGADFTERDAVVLELLRLRLQELHRLTRRRHLLPVLTSRQWEVMSLIARGISTSGIARTLFTSEATVRKHIENIFERLGVRSREAAVAAVMPVLGDSVGTYTAPRRPEPV